MELQGNSESGEGGGGINLPEVDAGWERMEGNNGYYYMTPPNEKGKRRKVSKASHISEVIKTRGYPDSIRRFLIFSKKKLAVNPLPSTSVDTQGQAVVSGDMVEKEGVTEKENEKGVEGGDMKESGGGLMEEVKYIRVYKVPEFLKHLVLGSRIPDI